MTLPLWAEYMAQAAHKMQPETTIEDQIKEVQSLIKEQPEMAKVMELTMKEYATECVKASLQKAANNASTIFANKEQTSSKVYKPSIANPQNIILC